MHRPLLRKHGLVDSLTMAAAVSDLTHRASTLLDDSGDPVLADWIRQNSASAHALLLPWRVAKPVWDVYKWIWDGEGPKHWLVMWDAICPHLADLEYLDLRKGLFPFLWMRRESLGLRPDTRRVAESQYVRVFYGNMFWEDCSWNQANDESDRWEYGWMMGMDPSANAWWRAETLAAAVQLTKLSRTALTREVRRGDSLQEGGACTQQHWDLVYRERKAKLPYAVDANDENARHPTVSVRLPELGAIAFYHIDQLHSIYEGIMGGRAALDLLSDLSDADFKRGRVAGLRSRLGYPRTETRGRPSRDESTIEKIGLMVETGVPKYRISKLLGIPRSTVYDHWREYVRSRNPRGAQK